VTEARLESLDQLALQTRLDAIGKATFSARRERLCYRSTSEMGRCCRKSRKSKNAENLAIGEFWITPPLRCPVVLIRRSVIVLLIHDVVPHVAAHETHQRL